MLFPGFSVNGLEALLMVFALALPAGNILVLLTRRASRSAGRLGVVIPNIALLVIMFVYLIAHQRIQNFDMEGPELLVFSCMLVAPMLSIVAHAISRDTDEPKVGAEPQRQNSTNL